MNDPRKAQTLGEAALNPDSTWNGARALSWLSEVLHLGKGLSEGAVKAEFEKAKAEADARRAGKP